ncbi:MAG: glyceraldehyde 3-phosphate dehydrogenase NAD-binding domain-containing protein [Arcobacteraceae bacterium]|jgi:glyceraldehyde 3-phosphate dehydrogenase|nr:glyceraldehyde 3-phosphate dehydrogenase NAD-binding domain-containing protein [Arcobacteraceae bacterium]
MKILLNGVGRIGKSILRLSNSSNLEIVAINEINQNIENIAYLINYDSTYGKLDDKFEVIENHFIKNSTKKIQILNHNTLDTIDYKAFDIDIIIDASGQLQKRELLEKLDVKAIFLTHPSSEADINIVLGANEEYMSLSHKIISTSSCNASALLPFLKLIDDNYKIISGDIVTIHPLLNHQKTLDSKCIGSLDRDVKCNFEFGRSATQNIIPSKTTTIEACSYVFPTFNSTLISSSSLRVPTPTVGAINVVLNVEKSLSLEELNTLLEKQEATQKYDIFKNIKEPLVSSDFQGEVFSTIIDAKFTQIINHNMIKTLIWYDNEFGYASKVVEIVNRYIMLKSTNNQEGSSI